MKQNYNTINIVKLRNGKADKIMIKNEGMKDYRALHSPAIPYL